MGRNRRNEKWVYCKHSETLIVRGKCDECNEAKRAVGRNTRNVSRFTAGYHYGLGQEIGTERELYRVAEEQNATVRWD